MPCICVGKPVGVEELGDCGRGAARICAFWGEVARTFLLPCGPRVRREGAGVWAKEIAMHGRWPAGLWARTRHSICTNVMRRRRARGIDGANRSTGEVAGGVTGVRACQLTDVAESSKYARDADKSERAEADNGKSRKRRREQYGGRNAHPCVDCVPATKLALI